MDIKYMLAWVRFTNHKFQDLDRYDRFLTLNSKTIQWFLIFRFVNTQTTLQDRCQVYDRNILYLFHFGVRYFPLSNLF